MRSLHRIFRLLISFSVLGLLSSVFCRGADNAALPDGIYAEFTTPRGVVVVELFANKVPLTVTNFVGLAEGTLGPKQATPWYTGLKWYRVVPGFVIQSGDPANPGGGIQSRPAEAKENTPGYTFVDEFSPGLRHGEAGILSMANGGPDTNSAEFFLTLGDCTRLNYLHSVYGRVIRGLEVLPQIKPDDAFSIKILRVGAAAKAFKADEPAFQALVAKGVPYASPADLPAVALAKAGPGPSAHFDDPAKVLPQDVPRAKNFNFKLNNFQRATGQRVFARVYPAFTPADDKETPTAFTQKLARSLALDQDGVLAVYFADKDQWYVWVGSNLMAVFNPERQRAADVKNALYQAVKIKAAEYTEQARKLRGPDNPLKPADLAKYSVDAMLDLLIFQFEPKPKN